jgi:hypothetical protein
MKRAEGTGSHPLSRDRGAERLHSTSVDLGRAWPARSGAERARELALCGSALASGDRLGSLLVQGGGGGAAPVGNGAHHHRPAQLAAADLKHVVRSNILGRLHPLAV